MLSVRLGCGSIRRVGDDILTLDVGCEPVGNELLLGRRLQVSLCETTRSDVDLSNLTDSTKDVAIVSVDNKKLDVDHSGSGGHDVLLGGEESAVIVDAGDSEVGHGALRLGRSVHVDDSHILGEILEAVAIALGEDISDEESVAKGWDLASRLRRQELTHGWRQVGDCDVAVSHPICKPTRRADVI